MNNLHLKHAARIALDVITAIFLAVCALIAAVLSPPAHAEDKKHQFIFENKLYKLECSDKEPDGCQRLISILRAYDEEAERRRQRILRQNEEEEKKEKENLLDL